MRLLYILFFIFFPLTVFGQSQNSGSGPDWVKVCFPSGDNEECNVSYTSYTQQGQLVSGINLATLTNTTDSGIIKRAFQVTVPSWRSIPSGVIIQIDGSAEINLPYVVCLPNRCIAEVPLTDDLVSQMKSGTDIKIKSRNFRNRPDEVMLTLVGFTKAYDGDPLAPEEIQSLQRSLESDLQKKAEETRRKLIDAQNEAKSGE